MASLTLVHDIVNNLSHLLLVVFKHLNLALHELSLAVHQRLWNHVNILSLHELLAHLVQKGVHLTIGDLLQLCLMVLKSGCGVCLLRAKVLVQGF